MKKNEMQLIVFIVNDKAIEFEVLYPKGGKKFNSFNEAKNFIKSKGKKIKMFFNYPDPTFEDGMRNEEGVIYNG
jgi:hypothetical protein